MTRINIVDPKELYDQHLMAEYRELLMVPASLKRTLKSVKGLALKKYPKQYTLGKGHVVFFYNKGKYLEKRYNALAKELRKRGFKLNKMRVFPSEIFKDNNLFNDWVPSAADKKLIRERLAFKIALKPYWYRKTAY